MEKMTLYVVVLAMFKITVIMPIPSNAQLNKFSKSGLVVLLFDGP